MCYSVVLRGNLQREVPLGIRVMSRRWNAGSLKASPGRVGGSDKGDQLRRRPLTAPYTCNND